MSLTGERVDGIDGRQKYEEVNNKRTLNQSRLAFNQLFYLPSGGKNMFSSDV